MVPALLAALIACLPIVLLVCYMPLARPRAALVPTRRDRSRQATRGTRHYTALQPCAGDAIAVDIAEETPQERGETQRQAATRRDG